MPTAAIDFSLASFAMIIVVIGAIFGVNLIVSTYFDEPTLSQERYQQIGKYILLNEGEPSNWSLGRIPLNLGLAKYGNPYDLDLDKVTRLNQLNKYSINYSIAWHALGIDDVSFRLEVDLLFDITLNLTSSKKQGDTTSYNFSAKTTQNGYPIPCQVKYYIAIKNSTFWDYGTTDNEGTGTVQFTISNSQNGTAVLIGLAKATESIFSYKILRFAHNSSSVNQSGSFAILSPLNQSLFVDLTPSATALNAAIFTYHYHFNLTTNGNFYVIPKIIDGSPKIITLTGINGSSYWAEWVAYPQIPLVMGADMSGDYVVSDVNVVSYLVNINGSLYRLNVKFRSPMGYE